MKKKGNMILAGLVILAMIFSLVLVVFMLKVNVLDPFNADVQASDDYGTDSKQISSSTSTNYASQWDFVIVLVFITAWVSSMLLGRDLDTNVVYFGVAVIIMIFVVMVGMMLEGVYEDTIGDPEYVGIELSFPYTHWLMTHLVQTIIIVMLSIGVVLYGKG